MQTIKRQPPLAYPVRLRSHPSRGRYRFLNGEPEVRIHEGIATAPERLAALAETGIDLDRVTDELEDEGVDKFAASYDELLEGIEAKQRTLGVAVAGD